MYRMSLFLNIFAQFQCNDNALKITTNFSDDSHFACIYLKFRINANIVYFQLRQHSACPCPLCAQITVVNILTRMVYHSVYCVLTLIPAEPFNRTERSLDNQL